MLVPISAKHLEAAYLRGAPDMLADAGTDVVIADAHQPNGFGGILGQTAGIDLLREFIASDELEGDRQVGVDQLIHATLYLLLFLTRGLMIDMEAHLALLTLDMGVERALAAKEADHRLVQQMLRRMGWRELFLVVLV